MHTVIGLEDFSKINVVPLVAATDSIVDSIPPIGR